MTKPRESEILQGAAVVVAAPRYMGAFAYALGVILPAHWQAFQYAEIWSGLAMALLEGWAIAYISRHWRRASGHPRRVLMWLQIVLMILLPTTTTPYLYGAEAGTLSLAVMPVWLVWLWKFAVAAIAPLVVLAVGYASGQKPARAKASEPSQRTEPAKPAERAKASHVCPLCKREFGSQAALNAHGRKHKKEESK